MSSRLAIATGLVAALVTIAAACGGSTTPPADVTGPRTATAADGVPTTPPGIRGTVTRVVTGDSVVTPATATANPNTALSCPPSCTSTGRSLRGVLIEETPGGAGDKGMVTLLAGAKLLRRSATSVGSADFADLRTGQRVAVWYDGPIMESYPTQGRAGVLVIEP